MFNAGKILKAILSVFALSTKHAMDMPFNGSVSGAYKNRMSLGGLPPKWKGKRRARIMRGGK
jgi:hypothetical protein